MNELLINGRCPHERGNHSELLRLFEQKNNSKEILIRFIHSPSLYELKVRRAAAAKQKSKQVFMRFCF